MFVAFHFSNLPGKTLRNKHVKHLRIGESNVDKIIETRLKDNAITVGIAKLRVPSNSISIIRKQSARLIHANHDLSRGKQATRNTY